MKINSARPQHDTERTQNREGLLGLLQSFVVNVCACLDLLIYVSIVIYNNNNYNNNCNNNNNFFSGSTKRRTGELIMDGVEERNADHVTNHAQYVEINEIHSYELKRDDIKFERLVGSGNFGEVFKATIDNNTVAVKSLKGKIYVTLPCFCLHSTSCSV